MEKSFEKRELLTAQASQEESWADKALREVQLVGTGFGGFADAARSAVVEHPLKTAASFALTGGAGAGLAYLSRGSLFGSLAVRAAGIAAGYSFLTDVVANGAGITSALKDNWQSAANWDRNAATMRSSLGQFAFNTTLMSLGSMAGARLGQAAFLAADRAKMPSEFFTQMSPSGVTEDYHNKLITPGFYAANAQNAAGKLPAEKVLKAQQKLPALLKEIPTYSQYWDGRVAEHLSEKNVLVDRAATQRVFVQSQKAAATLDRLSTELRGFAGQDLSNQQILNQVVDRFGQVHKVIYGK